MQKYRKFIFKFLVLCTLVFVLCFTIIMPQFENGYLASFKDKYELEHKFEGGGRIILMGDSNVAFGIDSECIEKEIGMPVINMGLHGGLGQAFCMDMAKSGIHEGDIVIILPAWFKYDETTLDATLAWTLLENDVMLWREVNPRDYAALAQGYPAYLKKALMRWVNNQNSQTNSGEGYTRSDFNAYGDIQATGGKNIMENGYLPNEDPLFINDGLIDYFNRYNQYVTERGAMMLLACAPIIDSPDRDSDEEYAQAYGRVKEVIEMPFISSWEDYVYPMDYFYDTNFHLNDKGRSYRTAQLIEDIKHWMKSNGQAK